MLISKITAFIIISAFTSNILAASPIYQIIKYHELISQADEISADLNNYFNTGTDITRQGQMDMFEQKALPELKVYNNVANQLARLILPAKEKKTAATRSKIIVLECRLYQLRYLEFKYQDYTKYRPEINETTTCINNLKEGKQILK